MIRIEPCVREDLPVLRELSVKTFVDAFTKYNTPENMRDYLEKSFNVKTLEGELLDKSVTFYFLYDGEELVGYMKLNEAEAQSDLKDPDSIELERIYVKKEFQSRQFGHLLIERAAEVAKERGKAYVWLGVWEENVRAIAFYKRNGFEVIKTHAFFLGDEKQTDFVMRRTV